MNTTNKGLSVIEIVISAALIAIVVVGIVGAVNVFFTISVKNTNQAQAALLLEETLEILQYLRDDTWTGNFSNASLSTNYHLDWSGADYSTTTTPVLVNGKFTRIYNLDAVKRDDDDDIVSSGGTIDPGTLLVNVDISWQESSGTASTSSQFLIHNVYQN
jgi:Tfp pilus assembly protein PilE